MVTKGGTVGIGSALYPRIQPFNECNARQVSVALYQIVQYMPTKKGRCYNERSRYHHRSYGEYPYAQTKRED